MDHLGLPHPRLMAQAVPANLRCGHTEGAAGSPANPSRARLVCNFGGIWKIQPADLHERVGGSQPAAIEVPDVRKRGGLMRRADADAD